MKTVHTSGKRKRAIARATAKPGKGIIRINSRPLGLLRPEIARMRIEEPLLLAEPVSKKVNISVEVVGGGWSGQAEAARLAIARALVEFAGDELKQKLLDYDRHLLIADTRRKEPRKWGTHSRARAKRQMSYR